MSKLYLFVVGLLMFILPSTSSEAQHIIAHHIYSDTGGACGSKTVTIQTDIIDSNYEVDISWGDGSGQVLALTGVSDSVTFHHVYDLPGVYSLVASLRHYAGGVVDNFGVTCLSLGCKSFGAKFFVDTNANCIQDSLEPLSITPVSVAIDSNGVTIDTIASLGGFYYTYLGNPGDVYSFHIVGTSAGVLVTCPASGVIYDTVSTVPSDHLKNFGVSCAGVSGFDAGVTAFSRAGVHAFLSDIIVTDQYCTPGSPITLTMSLNPSYTYVNANPVPTTISGSVLTWLFPSIDALSPQLVSVLADYGSHATGDTVHTSYTVTPVAGDSNLGNNAIIVIDTVDGSFDPNSKSVSPSGDIHPGPGTTLTYTIHFENTGTDTAFNIHIMDVLSPYVDPATLRVLAASAPVYTYKHYDGTYNVVKFDFPNINLLDSSHHGLCDGFVRYSIKTYDNLPLGIQVQNTADIYFDYNEPITTNTTANNVVDWPAGIAQTNRNIDEITVFPNPATDNINISITWGNYNSIVISDLLGRSIVVANVMGSVTRLDVSAIPSGSYFLTLKGKDGVKVKQFVKM